MLKSLSVKIRLSPVSITVANIVSPYFEAENSKRLSRFRFRNQRYHAIGFCPNFYGGPILAQKAFQSQNRFNWFSEQQAGCEICLRQISREVVENSRSWVTISNNLILEMLLNIAIFGLRIFAGFAELGFWQKVFWIQSCFSQRGRRARGGACRQTSVDWNVSKS